MLTPKEQSRIMLDELGNRTVLFVTHSGLGKTGATFEAMRQGKAVANRAAVEAFEDDLAGLNIRTKNFTEKADALFERATCVENWPEIEALWGYDAIAAYWAGTRGALVAYSAGGTVRRIEAAPYSDGETLPEAVEKLRKLAESLGLEFVDFRNRATASPEDAGGCAELFSEFEIEKSVEPDEPAPPQKRTAGSWAFLIYGGFVLSNFARHAKNAHEAMAIVAVAASVLAVSFGAVRIFGRKVRSDHDGIRTFWGRNHGFLPYSGMEFVVSRRIGKAQESGFLACVDGSVKAVRATAPDAPFDAALRGMREDRKSQGFPKMTEGAAAKAVALMRGRPSSVLRTKSFLAKWRIARMTAPERFCLEFGKGGWCFADGTRFLEWETRETPKKASEGYCGLAGEALWEVGATTFGRYRIIVGESGKTYLGKGEFLHLVGKDPMAAMARILAGGPAVKSLFPYRRGTHPARFAGPSWEYSDSLPLPKIEKKSEDEEGWAPYGPDSVCVLTCDGGEDRVSYDFDTGSTRFVRYQDTGDWKDAVEIEPKNAEWILGWKAYDFRILCPAPLADEFAQAMREALEIDGPTESDESVDREVTELGKIRRYPAEAEAGQSGFRRFLGNPDWHGFSGMFAEDKLRKAHETIAAYRERFETEYATAYFNAVRYSDAFPKNFFVPQAAISPIAPWITGSGPNLAASSGVNGNGDEADGSDDEPHEFSLKFLQKYGHEICFDLCGILGIPADPTAYSKACRNDGLPGVHCLAIYAGPENREFVILDCQNADDEYAIVVRTSGRHAELARARLEEWRDFFEKRRGRPSEGEIRDEYGDADGYLPNLLNDCRITESEALNAHRTDQYAYMGSLRHKFDVFRWKMGWRR